MKNDKSSNDKEVKTPQQQQQEQVMFAVVASWGGLVRNDL